MIISRTPFRISFFGGGTDYPGWYEKNGGAVLSSSFDKYCYITCRELPPFFDHKYRITYSRLENAKRINDIEHPAVRAVLEEMNLEGGLEIHCDADLPARSGLGSSSSFIVGMLHSLSALKGVRVSKEWLANEAIRIEQKVLCESVGSQDQIAAAHGGFNIIHFSPDGSAVVDPLALNAKRRDLLNSHLMLFFTGFSRISSEIASEQISTMDHKAAELKSMQAMVYQGVDILCGSEDIRSFGDLLHSSWMLKRSLSKKITNAEIDALYDRACASGAIGGKILGAGGGGFMLMFVEPYKQQAVRQALKDLVYVDFKFENSGSQIIYYQP